MRIERDDESLLSVAELEKKIDAVARDVREIKRHFLWQSIWGTVRFLVIVIPIAWAVMTFGPTVLKLYAQIDDVLKQIQVVLPPR